MRHIYTILGAVIFWVAIAAATFYSLCFIIAVSRKWPVTREIVLTPETYIRVWFYTDKEYLQKVLNEFTRLFHEREGKENTSWKYRSIVWCYKKRIKQLEVNGTK